MRLRLFWLCCLLGFGCHCLADAKREAFEAIDARQRWQEGQAAMRAGQPERAIRHYEASLAEDAQLTRNHLSLAAAFLEKGDDVRACEHLGEFLRHQPEHRNARYYYAELLLKLGKADEALTQFEEAVAYCQDETAPDLKHLVHCHGRLMEVGAVLEDDYVTHLHRGIGMLLLARQWAGLRDEAEGLSAESLLCKAAAELSSARALRPAEARPCWYLYVIWRQLGQQRYAERWLGRAGDAAPFTFLTPAEQRGLQLAVGSRDVAR